MGLHMRITCTRAWSIAPPLHRLRGNTVPSAETSFRQVDVSKRTRPPISEISEYLLKEQPDIQSDAARWLWIESIPLPVAVVSVSDRTIAAANQSAATLLSQECRDLVGQSSSKLIADYLLPPKETIEDWIAEAASGNPVGLTIDILIEATGSDPMRLEAHIGPADKTAEFVLLTLQDSDEITQDESVEDDEALLGLMSDIGRIVGSSLDLETVSQRFAISLMHVVPAEHVAILLLSGDQNSLEPVFSTGGTVVQLEKIDAGLRPIERAIETGMPVLLSADEIDLLRSSGAAAWPDMGKGVLAACCVPLVANGECVGVTLLASALEGGYTTNDLALLEHASAQIAGAISNVALHGQIARDSMEREVLANIGKLASTPIDLSGAMPGIAAEINRFFPVAELCVYEPEDITGELAPSYRWSESDGANCLVNKSAAESIAGLGENESDASARLSSVKTGPECEGVFIATAPLMFGGEQIGMLAVMPPQGHEYGQTEVSFTALLASQIAGAVYTARAYRTKHKEARLRRALARISVAASKDLASEKVFERIGNEVAELIEYDLFAIALMKPDETGMTVRFSIGSDSVAAIYERETIETSDSPPEWREQIIKSIERTKRFSNLANQGIQSLMEVSLGVRETGASGYILVGTANKDAFTERELKTLAEVAAQVTPAIQNSIAHEQAVALAEARTSEARAEARNLELEKINDAKSRFLSIVSHELRTPLTSIIAYAELLERNMYGNLEEKELKQAEIINKSAMHLKFLISDLLDVSRIESGNLSLQMSNFDVGDVMRDVIEQFEPVLAEKKQQFEVHIASENIMMHGDRSRILQVVSNLIENASKYSPSETTISVDVHRRGEQAVIAITDEGIGVSEEDKAQLFVPFFRANSKLTRSEPGTGLGLALVKSIAELHGGTVKVDSKLGEGSTFSVSLNALSKEQAA